MGNEHDSKDDSRGNSDLISNVLGCKVQSIAVEQVGQGIGLMGDIFKVVLSGDAEAEALGSVVVKLPSS